MKIDWNRYLPVFIMLILSTATIVAGITVWIYESFRIPNLQETYGQPERLLTYYEKIASRATKAFEEIHKEMEKEEVDKRKLSEKLDLLEKAYTAGLAKLGIFTDPEIQKALHDRNFKIMLLNGIRLVKPFENGDIYLGQDILGSNAIVLDLSNQRLVSNELDKKIFEFFSSYSKPINVIYSQHTIRTGKSPKLIDGRWGKGGYSLLATAVASFSDEVFLYDNMFFTKIVSKLKIKGVEASNRYWEEISSIGYVPSDSVASDSFYIFIKR